MTILSSGITAQTGKAMDNLSMSGKILNMERKYAIYLPPGYETSLRSYPVLYLLQGAGDDQTSWVQGDDDFLSEGNSLVHIAMGKKEIPHDFRIRDGGHSWSYWRTSLPVVLEFVSMSFHQH